MLRSMVIAVSLTLAAVTTVSAQGQGDARERAACRPDVMRFCKQLIKDNNDNVFSILERSATSAAGFVVFRHERDGLADEKGGPLPVQYVRRMSGTHIFHPL